MSLFAKPCPEIRWEDVVRIEAMGTDTFGPFEVWLAFIHEDGSKAQISAGMKGYWEIVESLHERFPSIDRYWRGKMAQEPWHVERVLFVRE